MNQNIVPIDQVLMVDPQFFDVEYAINPHMLNEQGELNQVDKKLAGKQWQDLQRAFQKINLKTVVLPAQKSLPDMVFSANQSFVFFDPIGKQKTAIISNMRSAYRQKETLFFKEWYQQNGYRVLQFEELEFSFEGNGDIIPNPDFRFFWGGCGPRTDRKVYSLFSEKLGLKFETLNLVHPLFYHLDTCFVTLGSDCCAVVKEAFDQESLQKIAKHFSDIVYIDLVEAQKFFAANAFCPDGKNVIVQKGTRKFLADLLERGFNVIEVDTSEYMKSGGSVYCMKMGLVEKL